MCMSRTSKKYQWFDGVKPKAKALWHFKLRLYKNWWLSFSVRLQIMVDTHKKCLNSVRYWKTICLTINGKHPKPSSEKNAIGICNGIGQTRDNAAYRIRISIWELWDRRVFTEMLKKFSRKKTRRGGNRNTQPGNREEMKIPGNTALTSWSMDTSICSSQEEPGRVQECNDHGTVSHGAEENMLAVHA